MLEVGVKAPDFELPDQNGKIHRLMDWHLHFQQIQSGKLLKYTMLWKEKKNYGKVSMGVVRTTYLIDEQGVIIKANDKVKAADDPENILKELD